MKMNRFIVYSRKELINLESRFLMRASVIKKTMEDRIKSFLSSSLDSYKTDHQRGDVPGWVLVVLMTTGLVTAIWTIAAPRLSTILKNSLDAMNGIR
jgi:hypothetical protein